MRNRATFVQFFSWLLPLLSLSLTNMIYAEQVPAVPPTTAESAAAPMTAAQPANAEEATTVLRQRVERYWAARQSRDLSTIYSLESAAQPGGWLKLENAMSLLGVPIRRLKIESIEIEGEQAKAKVNAEVNIGTFGWTPQSITDPWVLINGQWFHETVK